MTVREYVLCTYFSFYSTPHIRCYALQDLTFSYLHMTNRDMLILETFENPLTYLSGELSDEGSYSSYYTCEKF